MVTNSLHAISFLRTRPASLLLPFTIRRSAQSSSSGLPHRKRTYLPKRTCGNGSSLLVRTRSRTQVSGTLQRIASCLQSINSYCAANTPLLPASSLFALETVMVHHPSDSAQNRLLINHEIPTINDYLRCNACGDSNAVSTPPTRISEQAPAGSAKRGSCRIAPVDQDTASSRSEDAERHGLLRKEQCFAPSSPAPADRCRVHTYLVCRTELQMVCRQLQADWTSDCVTERITNLERVQGAQETGR